ncbi:squalene/phytoene synthase family protein [Sphingomonas sp. PL-96]|uniref:squalene/phytoene synthase family protein n=1 Tax=Sphingomonas sp. PL-96 TaxID=2887201 RepID=UPI001E3A3973|nr:squalene/phytoene synthase family protein [Sphingomonas sp. PL-96]MCC2976714.1 squalene/phytoene synthase family protein [Sphingomonas sp. PL-96]
MVNPSAGPEPGPAEAGESPATHERALVLAYVPAARRQAIQTLFALDHALADIVRTTTEPLIGQMRLTWWHDALGKLDSAPPPAQPVLESVSRDLLPAGVQGAEAAATIDGWDVLIEEAALDEAALRRFGEGRGGAFFALAAKLLGESAGNAVRAAGAGWALADLSAHLSNPIEAEAARRVALEHLHTGLANRWPRKLRPLGMLAHFARMDLEGGSPPGSPRRLGRVVWHRLSGR